MATMTQGDASPSQGAEQAQRQGSSDKYAHVPRDGSVVEPPWGPLGRSFTLGIVSLAARLTLRVANSWHITNDEELRRAAEAREPGRGLVTVSNHTSTLDDPFVLSNLMPWRFFYTEHLHGLNRWTMCAKEICFKSSVLSTFFRNGKTLPVERGGGIMQPVIRIATERLAAGDWVHVFPEGKIQYDGRLARPLRWGVGKVLCDAVHMQHAGPEGIISDAEALSKYAGFLPTGEVSAARAFSAAEAKSRWWWPFRRGAQRAAEDAPCHGAASPAEQVGGSDVSDGAAYATEGGSGAPKFPLVVPFYHSGMGDVMPLWSKFPSVGHDVRVAVGAPIEMDDVLCKCARKGGSTPDVWMEIASRIEQRLSQLAQEVPDNTDQLAKLGITHDDIRPRRKRAAYANLAQRWREAKERGRERLAARVEQVKEKGDGGVGRWWGAVRRKREGGEEGRGGGAGAEGAA
ncbi:unnamed protein product [Pedinophyceae sp. YPF-701]|nr:unnamed protein product [Pedinophyceae sp. YPF-701]